MQNYTYHSHTNSLGIFDGADSADKMIGRAEELGFCEIGISNHLICHPGLCEIDKMQAMYFRDYQQAENIYKKAIDDIREAAAKHKIKVYVGFEVDYFNDKDWLNFFERVRKSLDVDYYIGASHFIYNNDFSKILKISYLKKHPDLLDEEILSSGLTNHWRNLIAAIKSGWFTFMAHIDQITAKGFCTDTIWDDLKWQIIETFASSKTGCELSTKGLRQTKDFFPATWIVKELNKHNVPLIISDDAHSVSQLGENFNKAETFLAEINYRNRIKF